MAKKEDRKRELEKKAHNRVEGFDRILKLVRNFPPKGGAFLEKKKYVWTVVDSTVSHEV